MILYKNNLYYTYDYLINKLDILNLGVYLFQWTIKFIKDY